jgi:hypothetical protein
MKKQISTKRKNPHAPRLFAAVFVLALAFTGAGFIGCKQNSEQTDPEGGTPNKIGKEDGEETGTEDGEETGTEGSEETGKESGEETGKETGGGNVANIPLTLYVRSTGNDGNSGETTNAPLQTIQAALGKMAAAYADSSNPWPGKGAAAEKLAEIFLLDPIEVSKAEEMIKIEETKDIQYPPLIMRAKNPENGENKGDITLVGINGTLITVGEGVTLTLRDITLKGMGTNDSALVKVDGTGAKLVLTTGAVITGNAGGGAHVGSGTLILETGAAIKGNKGGMAISPGGVSISTGGAFEMNGGKIRDNIGNNAGGGVHAGGGVFVMTGGEISGNESMGESMSGGGGVRLNSVDATFTMTGGTIRDNIASAGSGGGVSVGAGTFTMTGGTINGNRAVEKGGGVFVDGVGSAFIKYAAGTTYPATGNVPSGRAAGGVIYGPDKNEEKDTDKVYLKNITKSGNSSVVYDKYTTRDDTLEKNDPWPASY